MVKRKKKRTQEVFYMHNAFLRKALQDNTYREQ